MSEIGYLAAKFFAGGALVVAFSIVAGVLEPKRFSGIFSAAPSVLMASLVTTVLLRGTEHAAVTALGATAGGAGLIGYSLVAVLTENRLKGIAASVAPVAAWAAAAFGVYFAFLEWYA